MFLNGSRSKDVGLGWSVESILVIKQRVGGFCVSASQPLSGDGIVWGCFGVTVTSDGRTKPHIGAFRSFQVLEHTSVRSAELLNQLEFRGYMAMLGSEQPQSIPTNLIELD